MMLSNRHDAGVKLGKVFRDIDLDLAPENAIVIALPRGGVIVGVELARALKLPLDIILIKKIGAYLNPEYAIAAVGESSIEINNKEKVDMDYIESETEIKRKEIKKLYKYYRDARKAPKLKDKIVILVDDGMATGQTVRAAIKELRANGVQKIILAIPVAPKEAIEAISPLVESVIYLTIPEIFFSVGEFYKDFLTVPEDEVKKILNQYWEMNRKLFSEKLEL